MLAVDDFYLYRSITAGRPSTAMPAWSHLSAEDLAAVISHMRTWQQGPPLELRPLAPPGNYLLGETHYELSCQGCHGEGGRGGVGPQLANPVFLGSASDAALFHWIGRGREGTAMRGFLPEEEGPTRLTPHQIADVIAYLRHLGARANRPVLRTAVGDPVRGGELFAGNCVSCHGTEGEGASGPQLNNPTFLRSASDGFLYATLVLGRSGTPMRSMAVGHEGAGQIHPDQIQDVIAHVRQWDFPRTWRKPRVTVQLSEPALDSGRELYAHYCAGCHGPTGRGTRDGSAHFAPALNNPEFLGAVSDGFLVATIVRGRSGTPMRPFGRGAGGIAPLGLHQITDIVSFLRSWQDPLH